MSLVFLGIGWIVRQETERGRQFEARKKYVVLKFIWWMFGCVDNGGDDEGNERRSFGRFLVLEMYRGLGVY